MSTKSKTSSRSSANATSKKEDRVALTLKVSKVDYIRLGKLRLKRLETGLKTGNDLSHQEILYEALKRHLKESGV
jgi:hypothetical protein